MQSIRPESRVFRKDNVIFEVGSNLYDEKDVEQCVKNIALVSNGLERWVLISIPDKSKGITPEGAETAVDLLNQALHGTCAALLVLTTTTSAKIFAHSLEQHGLEHKFFCSESLMELLIKAETILDDPTLFMDNKRITN
ncbi:hypothetical protein OE749_03840 [Aestuariibacter sp. AA17]|uniref:Uncharacterized protein n=1 Tax=Fluctibacter corallii TaxID=2984329 RepID=A0ABT3A5H0_9ALTE|nr:hypothetical protein [Aestuariibacter sp. AA17]MCV2883832.1 hypothetical protein [Aestuariibacter sp. AA17]